MDSYAHCRLNNWSWMQQYRDQLGDAEYTHYIDTVYTALMNMKIGHRFVIANNVKSENIDLFIKITCMFILEGNYEYEFTNDYKAINRKTRTIFKTVTTEKENTQNNQDNHDRR